jgi:hypothetical protein
VQAIVLVVVALAGIRDLSTVRRLEIPPPLTQVIPIYHEVHGYPLRVTKPLAIGGISVT